MYNAYLYPNATSIFQEPGDCFCKSGFAGKNCDTCDIGYRNYPLCTPCPCHTAGTIGGSICEGECICKVCCIQ